MNYRDWQYHRDLLHHRDSAKFTKPTPRSARPADEPIGDRHPVLALTLVLALAGVLAIIGALLFAA